MDQTEQQYIDALFERLQAAERQSPPRDPNAERYIGQLIARQPGAPYYLAQAIIVQEEALKAAQQRIADLERELQEQPAQQGGGGFLGGLFGGGGAQPTRGTSVPPAGGSVPRSGGAGGFSYPGSGAARGGPAQPDPTLAQYNQGNRGGGFLAGAMQTAVGVAGGVLLGNMIGNMLGGDEAKAGEAAKGEEAGKTEQTAAEQNQPADDQFANVENTQYDDNDSVFGGDFDGGDFDI